MAKILNVLNLRLLLDMSRFVNIRKSFIHVHLSFTIFTASDCAQSMHNLEILVHLERNKKPLYNHENIIIVPLRIPLVCNKSNRWHYNQTNFQQSFLLKGESCIK